jgi:hypothetical protein
MAATPQPHQAYPAPVTPAPQAQQELAVPQQQWPATPVSGVPLQPVSGGPQPISGVPVSAMTWSGAQEPGRTMDTWRPFPQQQQPPAAPAKRPLAMLIIGMIVTPLFTGVAGYVIAATTAPEKVAQAPTSTASPSPTALGPYDANQIAMNSPKFLGELAELAEPWLPHLTSCAANTDANGPKVPTDRKRQTFCRFGNVALHFVEFASPAAEESAREYRHELGTEGTGLVPGVQPMTRKVGSVSQVPGSYIEYAFKDADNITQCGLWWDPDATSAALFMEAPCQSALRDSLDPLRDLWQRYS